MDKHMLPAGPQCPCSHMQTHFKNMWTIVTHQAGLFLSLSLSLSFVCPVSLPISTFAPSPSKRLACSRWPKVQRLVVCWSKGERLLIACIMVCEYAVCHNLSAFFSSCCLQVCWSLNRFNIKCLKTITDVSKCEHTCSRFSPPALFIVMPLWHLCRPVQKKTCWHTVY